MCGRIFRQGEQPAAGEKLAGVRQIDRNLDVRFSFLMHRVPRKGCYLDLGRESDDNSRMQIPGHVHNGVVVLDGGVILAEGTRVVVSQLSRVEQGPQREKKPVELPLVSSGEPGSVHLTNERMYEILDEEDLQTMKQTWDVPS